MFVWGCGRQEAMRNEVLGYSPLTAAVVDGDFETAKKLLQNGADTNARDAMDMTPLHHAVSYNNAGMVDLLLSNGADVNLKDEMGQTAMRLALGLAKLATFDDQIINGCLRYIRRQTGRQVDETTLTLPLTQVILRFLNRAEHGANALSSV